MTNGGDAAEIHGHIRLFHDYQHGNLRVINGRKTHEGTDMFIAGNHAVHVNLGGAGFAAHPVSGHCGGLAAAFRHNAFQQGTHCGRCFRRSGIGNHFAAS